MNAGLSYFKGCPDCSGLKIEDILKEILLLFVGVPVALRVTFVMIVVVFHLGGRGRPDLRLNRSFEDLVKFAAVEPDAAAFGTIINFDAGAFGDIQGYIADRTVHGGVI
jgi:hypothetical protein